MKRQIRNSVFETNSSSTHSIAIPYSCDEATCISFRTDEFGWGFNEVDAADYFYTAIYETSDTESEVDEKINKLKEILDEHGIEYRLPNTRTHTWHSHYDGKDYISLDYGYIDHGYELKDFVDELLEDGDKLVRFLSGGLVFTGNDNSDSYGFVDRNQEFIEGYDWTTNTTTKYKNEYYMSDHDDYEWHYKYN